MKREKEHQKIAAAYRPKRDAKRAETAQKRAAKRLKVETAGDTKVLGKRKADLDRDDVEADVAIRYRRLTSQRGL